MGVKIKDANNTPRLMKQMHSLAALTIDVGITDEADDKIRMIAAVQEYGCRIAVTPKMRAYLHHKGLHLRADTTHIRIPERSFIRAGFEQNRAAFLALGRETVEDVVLDGVNASAAANQFGEDMAMAIRGYMTGGSFQPNHPFTVSQKGGDTPLIDTGRLRGNVRHKVR